MRHEIIRFTAYWTCWSNLFNYEITVTFRNLTSIYVHESFLVLFFQYLLVKFHCICNQVVRTKVVNTLENLEQINCISFSYEKLLENTTITGIIIIQKLVQLFTLKRYYRDMERMSGNRFSFRKNGSDKQDQEKKGCHVDKIDQSGQHKIKYISQKEAHDINLELFTEYALTVDQLLELSGYSCAVAITTCYPVEVMSRENRAVLVCCGPGHNGGDGLVCARHLKMFGYKPTLFYPQRANKPLFKRLFRQCESLDIPLLSFFPSEPNLITDSYNFVVDALFGLGFKAPIKPEMESVIETLKKIEIPICSIDIPSGWDIEAGDENGLKPDMLISLTAPKMCATLFKGKHHFLGGRFVPKTLEQKYELNLPVYSGSDCIVEIKIENEETKYQEENDTT